MDDVEALVLAVALIGLAALLIEILLQAPDAFRAIARDAEAFARAPPPPRPERAPRSRGRTALRIAECAGFAAALLLVALASPPRVEIGAAEIVAAQGTHSRILAGTRHAR